MRFEVVEKNSGAKMSRTKTGETMGTTVFKSSKEAEDWMAANQLSPDTHSMVEVVEKEP